MNNFIDLERGLLCDTVDDDHDATIPYEPEKWKWIEDPTSIGSLKIRFCVNNFGIGSGYSYFRVFGNLKNDITQGVGHLDGWGLVCYKQTAETTLGSFASLSFVSGRFVHGSSTVTSSRDYILDEIKRTVVYDYVLVKNGKQFRTYLNTAPTTTVANDPLMPDDYVAVGRDIKLNGSYPVQTGAANKGSVTIYEIVNMPGTELDKWVGTTNTTDIDEMAKYGNFVPERRHPFVAAHYTLQDTPEGLKLLDCVEQYNYAKVQYIKNPNFTAGVSDWSLELSQAGSSGTITKVGSSLVAEINTATGQTHNRVRPAHDTSTTITPGYYQVRTRLRNYINGVAGSIVSFRIEGLLDTTLPTGTDAVFNFYSHRGDLLPLFILDNNPDAVNLRLEVDYFEIYKGTRPVENNHLQLTGYGTDENPMRDIRTKELTHPVGLRSQKQNTASYNNMVKIPATNTGFNTSQNIVWEGELFINPQQEQGNEPGGGSVIAAQVDFYLWGNFNGWRFGTRGIYGEFYFDFVQAQEDGAEPLRRRRYQCGPFPSNRFYKVKFKKVGFEGLTIEVNDCEYAFSLLDIEGGSRADSGTALPENTFIPFTWTHLSPTSSPITPPHTLGASPIAMYPFIGVFGKAKLTIDDTEIYNIKSFNTPTLVNSTAGGGVPEIVSYNYSAGTTSATPPSDFFQEVKTGLPVIKNALKSIVKLYGTNAETATISSGNKAYDLFQDAYTLRVFVFVPAIPTGDKIIYRWIGSNEGLLILTPTTISYRTGLYASGLDVPHNGQAGWYAISLTRNKERTAVSLFANYLKGYTENASLVSLNTHTCTGISHSYAEFNAEIFYALSYAFRRETNYREHLQWAKNTMAGNYERPSDCVFYYQYNQVDTTSGNRILDLSGNGNHLTLQNYSADELNPAKPDYAIERIGYIRDRGKSVAFTYNTANTTISGNTITKSSGSDNWDASVATDVVLTDGTKAELTFRVNSLGIFFIGLSSTKENDSYETIDSAVYIHAPNNEVLLYANGGNYRTVSFTTLDKMYFKVKWYGGMISVYSSMDAILWTLIPNTTVANSGVTGSAIIDTCFYSVGTSINDVRIRQLK